MNRIKKIAPMVVLALLIAGIAWACKTTNTSAAKQADATKCPYEAAQQQAKGSEQVARSMTEMPPVTTTSAASPRQTAAALTSLALLVDNLNAAASRFTLPPAPAPAETAPPATPRLVAAR